MEKLFINFTNHPTSEWDEKQIEAAKKYGKIIDMDFPKIQPDSSEYDIIKLANQYAKTILSKGEPSDLTIHIMGEQTFCHTIINILTKKGARCVASCTQRETFKFVKYRYYDKKIVKVRKDKISMKQKKTHFSTMALIWLLLLEVLIIVSFQGKCYNYFWVLIAMMIIPLVTLSYLGKSNYDYDFWPRTTIITRLMSNVIAPTWLGALYLFFFVIHIGWLTDGSLNLFLHKTYPNTTEIVESLIAGFFGTICIISFFPDSRPDNRNKKNKVFISGISALFNPPISLTHDRFSVVPLVKILLTSNINHEKCQFVILYSDFYQTDVKRETIVNTIQLDKEMKSDFNGNISKYFNDNDFDNNDKLNINNIIELDNLSTSGLLKVLIKVVAKHNIPNIDSDWLKNNISIRFTNPYNYNDYKNCFNALSNELSYINSEETDIFFNITPGTAAISAIGTLLSIDSKYKLFYHSQDEMDKENPIIEIDKTNLPFESLLSQALESIRK